MAAMSLSCSPSAFKLVSRLYLDAMIERAGTDASRSSRQRLDGNHHQARKQERRQQRQNETACQNDNGPRDDRVERRIGFGLGNFHDHEPVERSGHGMCRQHALAFEIACDLRFFDIGLRAPGSHLCKLRDVGIAQDEADLWMRDQPSSRVDNVGTATTTDPDLIDDIPDVGEVDLGHADAGVTA